MASYRLNFLTRVHSTPDLKMFSSMKFCTPEFDPWLINRVKVFSYDLKLSPQADPGVEVGEDQNRAPKAPRGIGCGEEVSFPHMGEGLGNGQCPLPRIFLEILKVKMAYFRGLLVLIFFL